jgi:hypothetical protein
LGTRAAEKPDTAVVAIGGNSLISDPQHQDVGSQWAAVTDTDPPNLTHALDGQAGTWIEGES